MADVFISYCRVDGEFVKELHQALSDRDRDVWVDWEDIPPAAEWRDELHEGIDDSKAVIFVITPDSLSSDECGLELQRALENGKRIIPVIREDPDSVTVPQALARRNYVFLRDADDFQQGVDKVVAALDADPAWVKTHTRLLNRAEDWGAGDRNRALLLRGTDLHAAEAALAGWHEGTEPAPTPLQREYVLASRREGSRRLRGLVALLSVALLVAIGLGVFALVQRSKAVDREHVASSRQLAVRGLLSLDSNPDYTMRLALRALHQARTPEAERALRLAVAKSQSRGALRVSRKPVAAVAVTNSGLTASATADGRVRTWDPGTGRVRSLHSHRGQVYQLGLTRNDRELLSDGADGVAWLENLRTGQARAFRAHGALAAGLLPNGGRVIGLDGQDDVQVWDAHTGRRLATLPTGGHVHVQTMSFDDHGHVVLVTYPDGRIQAWDADRRVRLAGHRVRPADFVDSSMPDDGRYAVSIGNQDRADVWDPRTGRVIHTLVISGATPLATAVSDDGSRIAVGYNDNTARLWSARTGRLLRTFRGHSDSVQKVGFSDDGRRLQTNGYDQTVRVWSTKTGEQLARFTTGGGGFEDASISSDGRYVATAGHDGVARLWEAAPGRTVAAIHTRGSIAAAALDPSGKVFASASSAGFQVASALTGQIVGGAQLGRGDDTHEIAFDSRGDWMAAAVGRTLYLISTNHDGKSFYRTYTDEVRTVDWSRDGRVVTAADDGSPRVIDPDTRQQILLPRGEYSVYRARFMPDGRSVVTSDSVWTVRDWRLSDRKVTDRIDFPDDRINALEVSRLGQVAVALESGDVVLWRPGARGRSRVLHLRHKTRVEALRFSRDGRRVATAADDAKARLWDTRTGHLIREFPSGVGVEAHTGILLDVDISPDGRYLITGSDDRTARVWDTRTGDQVAVFAGYEGGVFQTRFSPRGHAILTVPTQGAAALYACDACRPLDEVVKAAHRLLAVRDVSRT